MKILWITWLLGTVAAAFWFTSALPDSDSALTASAIYLPGLTSHGHYQIEMKCNVCHQSNGSVTDASCIECHGEDLRQARDTHPKSKFSDPTRATMLQQIDAQNCLTCHVEHQEEQTHAMGVTVPRDYCFHCHQDVTEDRPSHKGLAFDSCSNSGCHNYHDNTAIYENFLAKHAGEPDVHPDGRLPLRKLELWLSEVNDNRKQVAETDADAPPEFISVKATDEWAASAHAIAGVNCTACHKRSSEAVDGSNDTTENSVSPGWVDAPSHDACRDCHKSEVAGFLNGRHGMRLAVGLSPMTPDMARHPMHASSAHRELNCTSCHAPHRQDVQFAAYEACIQCHNDQHTDNYSRSQHYELWQAELSGEAPSGKGVSCATCHMPRDNDGLVQHNQNANLRPSEKMARTVCMKCHGLQFTLNSLADSELKTNCFSSAPSAHVKSPQMAEDWFESKKK